MQGDHTPAPIAADSGGRTDYGALRVCAIVPAYNEEETLAEVVAALRSTPVVHEILVVSDGSSDATPEVAGALGVRVLDLKPNRGKGLAMAAGVACTSAPILVFVDGDILNLSEYLLDRLVGPVVEGRADMNIGVRSRGALNPIQKRFGPFLSGIRCLRREIFEAVPADYLAGYRIEVGLNWACRHLGLRQTSTVLHHLKHRVKERKQGLWGGLGARLRMFATVLGAFARLKLRSATPRPAGEPAPAELPAESSRKSR